MTTPTKISYAFIALMLLLVGVLHLSTPFITLLFSYFALSKLSFGRSKGLAVALFLALVAAVGCGAYFFLKHAYVAVPKIVATTLPQVIEYAEKHDVELPFSDYDSLKALARETITETEEMARIGKFAKNTLIEVVAFIIGIVCAVSLFMSARFQLETESPSLEDTSYFQTWQAIAERFQTFYLSFATVMGAQMTISGINTALTAGFIFACHWWHEFPYASVLLVLTFLCGLLPIIGNVISNTLIVAVAFTMSPTLALWALVFLVAVHKLEYLLNSKIIGRRIKNPMWLTLLGLILGEKLMGVPGMILAPVVLHYIKVEASRKKFAELPIQTPSPPASK